MKYTDEQKKDIFHECIQQLLSKGKTKLMLDTCDTAQIRINVPDDLDPSLEAEITISIRRKSCQKN